MDIHPDFSELLALLNAHKVAYVVVGAHALAHYGAPRVTGDLDIFVQPAPENATRVIHALAEFGFGSLDLTVDDFLKPDHVVQLGYPPLRVDFMTSISGVSWEQVDAGKVAGHYGEVPVHYIGPDQYKLNKKAVGRAKDLADLESLGE